jgi:hypothetical protein
MRSMAPSARTRGRRPHMHRLRRMHLVLIHPSIGCGVEWPWRVRSRGVSHAVLWCFSRSRAASGAAGGHSTSHTPQGAERDTRCAWQFYGQGSGGRSSPGLDDTSLVFEVRTCWITRTSVYAHKRKGRGRGKVGRRRVRENGSSLKSSATTDLIHGRRSSHDLKHVGERRAAWRNLCSSNDRVSASQ